MYTKRSRHITRAQAAHRRSSVSHLLVMMLVMALCITCAVPSIGGAEAYAASLSAGGTINAAGGATLRAQTSVKSDELAVLANGTQVKIIREIFKKEGKTSAKSRWYYIKADGKKGYVRSDLVTGVTYPSVQAHMKCDSNLRSGPSTGFPLIGTIKKDTPLTVHGKARVTGSALWYMAEINGQICYIYKKNVALGSNELAVTTSVPENAPAEQAAPVEEASTSSAVQASAEQAPAPASEAAQAGAPAEQAAETASPADQSATAAESPADAAAASAPAQDQAAAPAQPDTSSAQAAETAAPADQSATAAESPADTAAASAPAQDQAAAPAPVPVSITVSGTTQPASLAPGKCFVIKGSIHSSAPMAKVVAGVTDLNGNWVLTASADINAASFDLAALDRQLKFGTLATGKYRYRVDVYVGSTCYNKINSDFEVLGNEIAANLLANPTDGGKARIVGTFDTKNCSRLFAVKGTKKAQVPQGMTICGDYYYLVYGMSKGQAVVTYSSSGQKLASKNLPFNMGHPNGITWNPQTSLCYIFRVNMNKFYTWNPADNSFGSAATPFSSSGIAYDESRGVMYATSLTGVRVYSADGNFSHQKLFSRCWHSGRTYIQDCGASNGYIFHCVSGASKHKTNYLDVYREADGKYLGTVKINIDEAESAAVGPDGYVQILCNTTKNKDYIWRTPLNVKDLH